MKDAMSMYFEKRTQFDNGGILSLFKTPAIPGFDSIVYDGTPDVDDYITWKPVMITDKRDFKDIEQSANLTLHPSILDYFNAYWFADLDGFYQGYYISLVPVLADASILAFRDNLLAYKENHDGCSDKIPIGTEGNGLIVVVDNNSGVVQLEDFERRTFVTITYSVQELIVNLSLTANA